MSDSASRFDIIERLLNHGLHPVVEAVLFMLSVEDICQFESVCRLWNTLVDERYWQRQRKIVFSRDPLLEALQHFVDRQLMLSCDKDHDHDERLVAKTTVGLVHKLDNAWQSPIGKAEDLAIPDTVDPVESRLEFESTVLSVHYDPESRYFLVGLNNGFVQEWREEKSDDQNEVDSDYVLVRCKECHSKGVKAVTKLWGSVMVTGSYDRTIKIWTTGKLSSIGNVTDNNDDWFLHETLNIHSDAVWDLRVVRDLVEEEPTDVDAVVNDAEDFVLATCGLDGRVNILTCRCQPELEFNIKFVIQAVKDEATCVDLNGVCGVVITGSDQSKVGLWDYDDGTPIAKLTGHTQGLTGARILADSACDRFHLGPLAVTSSYDGSLRLWSLRGRFCLALLRGHRDFVRSLDASPTRIASADFGGFIKIWCIEDLLKESQDNVVKFSRSNKEASRFEALDFVVHRSLFTHKNHITAVHVDAFRVVSGSRDKTVVVQDFLRPVISNYEKTKSKTGGRKNTQQERRVQFCI